MIVVVVVVVVIIVVGYYISSYPVYVRTYLLLVPTTY